MAWEDSRLRLHKLTGTAHAAALVIGVLLAGASNGGVNLKNGNFYISYADFTTKSGYSITRTYNSKSTVVGSFGFGWGVYFDTRLRIDGDGSATIREHGGGGSTIYRLADAPLISSQGSDLLLETIEGLGWFAGYEQRASALDSLARNAERRRRLAQELSSAGWIEAPSVAIGALLKEQGSCECNSDRPDSILIRDTNGYFRRRPGEFDRFDRNGYLVEVQSPHHHLRIVRDRRGNLRKIELHNGATIRAKTNSVGQIVSLSDGNRTATFEYDDNKNLTRSVDVGGNEYTFEYDAAHNLTTVRYSDGTALHIAYEPETYYVSSIEASGGKTSRYEYGNEPPTEPDETKREFTSVKTYAAPGDTVPVDTLYQEYRIRTDDSGHRWTAALLKRENDVESEIRYHPSCRKPIFERTGSNIVRMEYDEDCRLHTKSSEDHVSTMDYDPRTGKISRFVKMDSRLKTIVQDVEFQYDASGKLASMSGIGGDTFLVDYDSSNYITSLRGAQIEFKFEQKPFSKHSMPSEILIRTPDDRQVTYTYSDLDNHGSEDRQVAALKLQQVCNLLKLADLDIDLDGN